MLRQYCGCRVPDQRAGRGEDAIPAGHPERDRAVHGLRRPRDYELQRRRHYEGGGQLFQHKLQHHLLFLGFASRVVELSTISERNPDFHSCVSIRFCIFQLSGTFLLPSLSRVRSYSRGRRAGCKRDPVPAADPSGSDGVEGKEARLGVVVVPVDTVLSAFSPC